MSDDEEDFNTCPLCEEEMDLSDRNFLPCPCGYRVCMWCWHHIRENLNGLCPACRTPYASDPHVFAAVDRDMIVKKNRERKQKEKVEKKIADKTSSTSAKIAPATVDRKALHNFRVVQRNLLYVIGLPISSATEESLRKPEYFGQYGRIAKIVAHKNVSGSHPTGSAYVTFAFKEDAKAAIQALDGFWIDGHPLRASFGTTKYCNNFIKNIPCTNPECVYLHELGDDDDRFTKEEIQAGYTKLSQTPGKEQVLVTGGGGPSGTGKKPLSDPVLPPPVFIQENSNKSGSSKSTLAPTDSKEVSSEIDPHSTHADSNSRKDEESIDHNPKASLDPIKKEGGNEQQEVPQKEGSGSNPALVYSDVPAFNGLTLNAVFPVPVSSLKISFWSIVLKDPQNNLSINPFGQIVYPFSDLLNLTLPPVDAALSPTFKVYTESEYYASKQINVAEENKDWTITNQSPENKLDEDGRRIANAPSESVKIETVSPNTSFSALKQLFPGVNFAYGTQIQNISRNVP